MPFINMRHICSIETERVEFTDCLMLLYRSTHEVPMTYANLTHQLMIMMTSTLVDTTTISKHIVVLNITGIGRSKIIRLDV